MVAAAVQAARRRLLLIRSRRCRRLVALAVQGVGRLPLLVARAGAARLVVALAAASVATPVEDPQLAAQRTATEMVAAVVVVPTLTLALQVPLAALVLQASCKSSGNCTLREVPQPIAESPLSDRSSWSLHAVQRTVDNAQCSCVYLDMTTASSDPSSLLSTAQKNLETLDSKQHNLVDRRNAIAKSVQDLDAEIQSVQLQLIAARAAVSALLAVTGDAPLENSLPPGFLTA